MCHGRERGHCCCGEGCQCERDQERRFQHRFLTKAEQIAELESYLAE